MDSNLSLGYADSAFTAMGPLNPWSPPMTSPPERWVEAEFEELQGKVLIQVLDAEKDSDHIEFVCSDGARYQLSHHQDCCECVQVEDICGDVADLIGWPLGLAEEVSHDASAAGKDDDSGTWTFYKLVTNRGAVTIRWLGTSNGYYSEAVDFERLETEGQP